MSVPTLVITGADKGGVGKTMLARVLLDYCDAKRSSWRVYDGQAPDGSLKRFCSSAKIIDFARTQGRAEVLDGLAAAPVTLVDVPAGLLSNTLMLLGDWRFLDDVKRGQARLLVLHALGPTADSLREAAGVAGLLAEGGQHWLVRNCANGAQFEWHPGTHKWAFDSLAPAGTFELLHLDGPTRECIDAEGKGFADFIGDQSRSYTLRRIADKWLRDCCAAMDAVGLRAAVRG